MFRASVHSTFLSLFLYICNRTLLCSLGLPTTYSLAQDNLKLLISTPQLQLAGRKCHTSGTINKCVQFQFSHFSNQTPSLCPSQLLSDANHKKTGHKVSTHMQTVAPFEQAPNTKRKSGRDSDKSLTACLDFRNRDIKCYRSLWLDNLLFFRLYREIINFVSFKRFVSFKLLSAIRLPTKTL